MRPSRRNFLKSMGATAALHHRFPLHLFRQKVQEETWRVRLAADPLRPQYHLLPAHNWMNDPNGPIFWKGTYHMFFQYNPNAAVWGDMHWAHSISPDMIHWKHLPMALSPTLDGYDQDGCFSGSAVDDHGVATILYTGVRVVPASVATLRDGAHNFLEVQCLATARDAELLSWKKLPAPVLEPPRDPQLTGFRDPCLWHVTGTWYMGIGSGQKHEGGRVLLYRSDDLRHWTYMHPLASGKWNGKETVNPVASGEMWECPDFFALGNKHVLLYSTEGKVYWETGQLDPKEHVFHGEKRGLLDYGAYYAPKSQLDAKGRRILWGWIPETRPEAEYSAAGWAGCMSLPRELTAGPDGELGMRVIPELSDLETNLTAIPDQSVSSGQRRIALQQMHIENLSAEIRLRILPKEFRVVLTDGQRPFLTIGYDPKNAGKEWVINGREAQLEASENSNIEFRIFLDGSVVEAMANDRVALTVRDYTLPRGPLWFEISEPHLDNTISLQVARLQPISSDRLTT